MKPNSQVQEDNGRKANEASLTEIVSRDIREEGIILPFDRTIHNAPVKKLIANLGQYSGGAKNPSDIQGDGFSINVYALKGDIAGFIAHCQLANSEGQGFRYIGFVSVDPTYQRKGIMKSLVQYVELRSREPLFGLVHKTNDVSLKACQDYGFICVGEKSGKFYELLKGMSAEDYVSPFNDTRENLK